MTEFPILEKLHKEQLTSECVLCSNSFNKNERRPKKIPCGHTFCKTCIGALGFAFTCPLCRTETHLDIHARAEQCMSVVTNFEMMPLPAATSQNSENNGGHLNCDGNDTDKNIEVHFVKVRRQLEERQNLLQLELAALQQTKKACERSIDQYFNGLTKAINRRRQLMKQQLGGMIDDCVEKVDNENGKVTFTITCLSALQKHSLHSTDSTFNDDILSEIAELVEKVEDLRVGDNLMAFAGDNTAYLNIEQQIMKAGKLNNIGSFPLSIQAKPFRAMVGVQSQVDLIVSNFDQETLDLTQDFASVLSMIVCDSHGNSIPFTLTFSDDSLLLETTPNLCGRHTIRILYEDFVLCECDFLVENQDVSLLDIDVNLNNPNSIAINHKGEILLTDVGLGALYKLGSNGKMIWMEDVNVGGDVCFDVATHNNIIVCTLGKTEPISESYECHGELATNTVATAQGFVPIIRSERRETNEMLIYFHRQCFVAIHPEGHVVLLDTDHDVISVCNFSGEILRQIRSGGRIDCPSFITFNTAGQLLISDIGYDVIHELDMDSKDWHQVGVGTLHSQGRFESPVGVAYLSDGRIVVCDVRNERLQVLSPEGKCLFFIHEKDDKREAIQPWTIAADADHKCLLILEKATKSLLKLHIL